MQTHQNENSAFTQKVTLVYKIGLLVLLIALLMFYIFDIFLLTFAGVLIAVFFNGLTHLLSDHTKLPYKWSLLVLITILTLVTYLSIQLMAPSLVEQARELRESIPESGRKIQQWFGGLGLEEKIQDMVALEELMKGARGIFTKATGVISGFALGIIHGLIFLMVGIYMAYSPVTYKTGFLKLFPKERRKRLHDVINEVGHTLQWWLIGRFIDMAFVGILTWIGLVILDVPLALILALIAAILNFIPNIGPFLGAIPALLIGVTKEPILAFYIAILYTIIQTLESSLITPLIQQKAISLPPAITIVAQIVLGATYGTLGLLVATPLLASMIVLVNRLYVNDVLHDED
jgi:predicted PurR-regulated permease PerM